MSFGGYGKDANKVPLGRPPPIKPPSSLGSSLLKPSYLRNEENSPGGQQQQQSSMSYPNYSNDSSGYGGIPNKFSSEFHSRWGSDASEKSRSDDSYGGMGKFSNPATAAAVSSAVANITKSLKRDSSYAGNEGDSNDSSNSSEPSGRKRKRRSRWMGSENEKAVIPGMPTILPSDLNESQREAYIAQLQIEEITRKLRTGDMGIPANPEERSPSPEPIYGTDGKRLNTREYRTRKKLEEDRHKLIQRLMTLNPEYKPPSDYRAPVVKIVDRVAIPQEEHPEINFVGLLIGPRGNTLKGLEKDTGAKIIIRGKGSVKEGKVGGKAGHPLPGEDEPLHAYVTSNNPDSVKKACDKIREIIRQGIDMPESQNDLRKMQLRELALLNGTLREGEGPKCSNCGATSHRTWNCPDKPNVTNNVICTVCGGAGHIAKDCRMKRPGAGGPPTINPNEKAKIDEEYMSLMAELGEAPPPPKSKEAFNKGGLSNNGRPSSGNIFEKPGAPKALMSLALGPPGTSSGNSTTSDTTNSNVSMASGNNNGPPPGVHMSPHGVPPPPPKGNSMYPSSMPKNNWGQGSGHMHQPPPPGSEPKSSNNMGTMGGTGGPPQAGYPPPMPPPWGYPPPPAWGAPPASWAAPPPPPPGGAQPPPPGMYWQGNAGHAFSMNPPPPPPPVDSSKPPPPPPPS